MPSILDDLAVLTRSEALEKQATGNLTNKQLQRLDKNTRQTLARSWRRVRADITRYAELVSGQGYSFDSIASPVDPVAHAKTPLLPLFIQIIPPALYPTGQTRTVEIPSPQTSTTSLTGFQERIRQRSFSQDPLNPNFTGQVNTVDRIVAVTPEVNITVEVPELTPDDEVSQIQRSQAFLQNTQQRYLDFQTNRQASQRALEDQQPVRLDKQEVEDTVGKNEDVKRARKERIAPDLDSLRQQALQLLDLPPLLMYVNPSTFSNTKEFVVSDGNRTRNGYSVEFWGEAMPKLSMSGTVGAFWVDTERDGGGGLAVRDRLGSFAYQNFMQLYQTYRNNGYLYTRRNKDDAIRIATVGSVNLFYDNTIYTGSFDQLSITHSEDAPFTLSYQFQFTVRYTQRFRDTAP